MQVRLNSEFICIKFVNFKLKYLKLFIYLNIEHQKFIIDNEEQDLHQLALKAHLYPHLPIQELITQIAARQKAKIKLPTFYANMDIVYPPMISMEQCSSEQTATYKASLLKGNVLIDLTGGFGIDAYFFGKNFKKVIYIEKNEALAKIAQQNFEVLGAKHIEVVHAEAETFIKNYKGEVDYIYIDPARRNQANKKVFLLEDCEPNILDILPWTSAKVVLKTSPMLDIDLAIKTLKKVSEVFVLAVDNECKEVVYMIENVENNHLQNIEKQIHIHTINFSRSQTQNLSFSRQEEEDIEVNYSFPQLYLYEPNAAILKAGAFKIIAKKYHLFKLAMHTHLYTANHLEETFVGRTFLIEAVCRLDKKEIMHHLPDNKANISTRNFPLTVDEIRKKIGIREGGNIFLFAITNCEGKKVVLVCKKIY